MTGKLDICTYLIPSTCFAGGGGFRDTKPLKFKGLYLRWGILGITNKNAKIPPRGVEPIAFSSEKQGNPPISAAKSDANIAPKAQSSPFPTDPFLEELLNLWPSLAMDVRHLVSEVAKHSSR